MSADNGIYILPITLKQGEEPTGWRVIHGQAIENLTYHGTLYNKYDPEMLEQYYGKAIEYSNVEDARKEAGRLHKEYDDMLYVEYGIVMLPVTDYQFKEKKVPVQEVKKEPIVFSAGNFIHSEEANLDAIVQHVIDTGLAINCSIEFFYNGQRIFFNISQRNLGIVAKEMKRNLLRAIQGHPGLDAALEDAVNASKSPSWYQ